MADVTMPQLGETVTEGTITKWFKNVGDRVEADEVLFEVSTDKVDSEVSAPSAGFLTEIRVAEGTTVEVGVVLAVIGSSADVVDAPSAPAPVDTAAVDTAAESAPAVQHGSAASATQAPMQQAVEQVAEQVAPTFVPPPPRTASAVEAAAAVETVSTIEAASAVESVTSASPVAGASGVPADAIDRVLSPVVRKLINENGINPNTITGTGVGGRITREDVLTAIESRAGAAVSAQPMVETPIPSPSPVVAAAVAPTAVVEPTAAPQTPAAASVAPVASVAPSPVTSAPLASTPAVVAATVPAVPAVRAGARDQVVPFSNIRRRTGEHMVMSLHTAPHAFIAVEVDYSAVDKVRSSKKDSFKAEEGFSLTYMPFIARAVVDAIQKFPNVNASVSGDSLVVHNAVHLGVAVDLDFQGLMVPVVKDADGKRMRAIARDIADVAGRARSKKLTPDDISGGTFTLSNAGPYGIDLMQSVINQPQVGILSITSVSKKPVVVIGADGSDLIGIRPMGMLGLSWDHRAFDGAYAASFLSEVRNLMQSKDWSSEV